MRSLGTLKLREKIYILEFDVKKLGEIWFENRGKNPVADFSSLFIKDTRETWEEVGTVKIS